MAEISLPVFANFVLPILLGKTAGFSGPYLRLDAMSLGSLRGHPEEEQV